MSCISEILKLKGDKPFFTALNEKGNPWVAVEGGGVYKDYEYLIVLNHNGHRCGYVALPPGHPANEVGDRENALYGDKELDYNALDISCHGGLTFGGKHHGLKDLLPVKCEDNWIGFDCGHSGDNSDTECFKEYFGEQMVSRRQSFFDTWNVPDHHAGKVRDFRYVEKECKSIIDQLLTTSGVLQ